MKKIFWIVVCLAGGLLVQSQPAFNCDSLLTQRPGFIESGTTNDSVVQRDLAIIKHCGEFSETDSLLLLSPLLLLGMELHEPSLTYGTLISYLKTITADTGYVRMAAQQLALQQLMVKTVNTATWKEDSIVLQMLDLRDSELDSFRVFLARPEAQEMTYKQAFSWFNMLYEKPKPVKKAFECPRLTDYDSALVQARQAKKKLLLYFTGYSSINSRKMEADVLPDEAVAHVLSDFLVFAAYVDEREPLPPGQQFVSAATGTKITTTGDRWLELETTRFNSSSVPFFVIIDDAGHVVATLTGSCDTSSFLKFLQQAAP